MSTTAVVFYLYATIAVVCALGVVLARKPVHAVLFLFGALLSISALYLLLGSQFLAAMQLFVYGGAVTVLVLFVLMLTGAAPEVTAGVSRARRPIVLAIVLVFFAALSAVLVGATWNVSTLPVGDTASLASTLFSRYALPFELAGLALTISLVGAIVLARTDDEELPADEEGGPA